MTPATRIVAGSLRDLIARVLPTPATTRPPAEHSLKSWPLQFSAVLTGRKRFEIRRDDRSPRFESGDVVRLMEFDPFDSDGNMTEHARGYTGRVALYFVGYVSRGAPLPAGWCGFEIVSVEEVNRAALALRSGVGL